MNEFIGRILEVMTTEELQQLKRLVDDALKSRINPLMPTVVELGMCSEGHRATAVQMFRERTGVDLRTAVTIFKSHPDSRWFG